MPTLFSRKSGSDIDKTHSQEVAAQELYHTELVTTYQDTLNKFGPDADGFVAAYQFFVITIRWLNLDKITDFEMIKVIQELYEFYRLNVLKGIYTDFKPLMNTFIILYKQKLFRQENRLIFVKGSTMLPLAIKLLDEANHKLVTQENLEYLSSALNNSIEVARILIIADKLDIVFAKQSADTLQSSLKMWFIANILDIYFKTNPFLITEELYTTLVQKIEYCDLKNIHYYFKCISTQPEEFKKRIITADLLDILMEAKEHLWHLLSIFLILNQAHPPIAPTLEEQQRLILLGDSLKDMSNTLKEWEKISHSSITVEQYQNLLADVELEIKECASITLSC